MLSFGVPSVPLGGLHSTKRHSGTLSNSCVMPMPGVFNSTTVVSTRLNDGFSHMQCKKHACRLPYLPQFGGVQLQMLTGRRHGIDYILISFAQESIPGDNWSPVFTCKRADSQVRPSNAPRPLQTHTVPFASPNSVLEPCEGLYYCSLQIISHCMSHLPMKG